MNLSPHVTLAEATHTNTGLPNVPNAQQLNNMIALCNNVFEPVRKYLGKPIYVNSMFRSKEVNAKVGGSPTSQHCTGEAMDLNAGADNIKILHFIVENLDFDQVIAEFGTPMQPSWIHVSYRAGKNRKQKLRSIKQNGKTVYIPIS